MTKLGAEGVASGGLEGEIGSTQGSSSAEPETEAVGGDEIAREGECAKGEGEVAVGEDNLIGREDIRCASDKTVVGARGGQAPSEGSLEEEDGCEKADCRKGGRGGHVEMTEADRVDVRRDTRWGRRSRSERGDLGAKKEDHGEVNMRIYAEKITSRETYVRGMCGGCAYRCRARTGAFVGLMRLVTGAWSSAWVL